MGAREDDILDFDYIDAPNDSASRQGASSGGPNRRGRRRPPRIRPPRAVTPVARLAGLVGFAILLVVLLSVWVEGCSGDGQRSNYRAYADAMAEVAADSTTIGAGVGTLLTTPGLRQAELETKLGGLLQQQLLGVERARALHPPGPANPAHLHAVEALALRASGIEGLLTTFRSTKDAKASTGPGKQLAAQGRRLEASDVLWVDLYRRAFDAVTASRGIDVAAPPSAFVDNVDLYTAQSMASIWKRVHGASIGSPGGGLHGSSLDYVKAIPVGTQLSPLAETTIVVSTDLGFEVGVTNSGEEQEVQLEVTLTIPKQPNAIVKTETIAVIEPGETKPVLFTDFPDVPFGEGTTVQVSVKPVAGEQNTANNSLEYPVVFSLSP